MMSRNHNKGGSDRGGGGGGGGGGGHNHSDDEIDNDDDDDDDGNDDEAQTKESTVETPLGDRNKEKICCLQDPSLAHVDARLLHAASARYIGTPMLHRRCHTSRCPQPLNHCVPLCLFRPLRLRPSGSRASVQTGPARLVDRVKASLQRRTLPSSIRSPRMTSLRAHMYGDTCSEGRAAHALAHAHDGRMHGT